MDTDFLHRLDTDENFRQSQFPACRDHIFLGHAGVAPITQAAVDAMAEFDQSTATGKVDYGEVFIARMDRVRKAAARLFGGEAGEFALLGPTSLGISMVANGRDWKSGDEVIFYPDDYPANVYPWTQLESQGVKAVPLHPKTSGEITPDLVRAAITPRTRLIALASCHFLSGYRIDIPAIGALARENGILFSLDAIQTAGAFPTPAAEVDFLSADSHKWMLGPCGAGVVYVAKDRQAELRPSLYGAWNIVSPNFIAQDEIAYEAGARRYEPGVLNATGLIGMEASLKVLEQVGYAGVTTRLLELKAQLYEGLTALGWEVLGAKSGSSASGITTCTDSDHPKRVESAYAALCEAKIFASLRHDRNGTPHIRFSPHFYNTSSEIEQTLRILGDAVI